MRKFLLLVAILTLFRFAGANTVLAEEGQTLGIGGHNDPRVRVAIGKIANARGYRVTPPWEEYRKARYIVHLHSFEVKSDRWRAGVSIPLEWLRKSQYGQYWGNIPTEAEQVRSVCHVQLEAFGPPGWYHSSGYAQPGTDLSRERYGLGSNYGYGQATAGYERQQETEVVAIEQAVTQALASLPAPVPLPLSPPPTAPITAAPIEQSAVQVSGPPPVSQAASSGGAGFGSVPPLTLVVNPRRIGVKIYGPPGSRFWVKRWNLAKNETRENVYQIRGEGYIYLRVKAPFILNIGAVATDGRQVPARKENTGLFLKPGDDPNF